MLGLLLFPRDVSLAVRDGISLCTDTLFPALFPFLVLSGFLVKSGLAQQIARPLEKFAGTLFGLPGVCISALTLGLIAGYPTGVKAAVELYREGYCTRQEAERMLSFCNNCGPGFLISGIGCGLFGSVRSGMLLYAVHLIAAVLTGFIFKLRNSHSFSPSNHHQTNTYHSYSSFVLSVTESMFSFLNLAAFVLCFSAISRLVQLSGILNILSALLPISRENAPYFLLGLLEMTNGALNLLGGTLSERMFLAAALIGWGGLSVHCQVLSLLQDTDLSPTWYFRGKALHAFLCALITSALLGVLQIRYFIIILCFFTTVLFFRKKAVEKKRKVYYNAS